MLGLRMPELLLILLVVVLLFGAKKLPELGDSLGKGIRAFRKASEKGFAEDDSGAAATRSEQARLSEGAASTGSSTASSREKAEKKA